MELLKKILLFMLLLPVISYCAQEEIRSLDENEQKISSELSRPENLTLISGEGTEYNVPFKIAMQSNLIETSLKDDKDAKEIVLAVEDEYLQPLIHALSIIYKYKNFLSTKELYEKIQQGLYLKAYTLPELLVLLIKADYLHNEDLQNLIFDYFAQLILNGTISLGDLMEIINPVRWYLIEKYYYLRSPELRVTPENLLFQKYKELVDKLHWIVPAPQEFNTEAVGKRIIYLMNLSIQDLLDYDKDIQVRLGFTSQLLQLNLGGFSLRKLDGLKNVAGIAEAQLLDLSNNHLTELHANIFNGLDHLQRLFLRNNHLTELHGNSFNGLGNLQHLSLGNNHLTELHANIFNGLDHLQQLSLANNHLTELPKNIFNGLGNLQYLSLSNNQLTALHENIFNGLDHLQYLYLYNNQLTALHENIFNGLDHLKVLDLYNNQLTQASKNMLAQFKQNHPNVLLSS